MTTAHAERSVSVLRGRGSIKTLGLPTIATLGCFDGFHLGHQELLGKVAAYKAGSRNPVRALVVSFYPHPSVILGKAASVAPISSLRQNLRLLSGFGIDALALFKFTPAFSQLSAEEFLRSILFEDLRVRSLVLGADAAIGRGREGTAGKLVPICERLGIDCEVVPLLQDHGRKISSRTIRELIAAGQVRQASKLLGRPYAYDSIVRPGRQRGSSLGFPTANAALTDQILPARGVYASHSFVRQKWYDSVTNVGRRPTFSGQSTSLETFLLDYSGEALYGERIEVQFIEHLRSEIRFAGEAELRSQISADVEQAKIVLAAWHSAGETVLETGDS